MDNNGTTGLVVVQTVDVAGGCMVCGHALPMSRLVWGLSYRRMVCNDKSPSAGNGQPGFKRDTGIGNMILCLKLDAGWK